MTRRMFRSKIHRAVVTEANLNYEGSVSIDVDLMDAADILPNEEVHIWNVTNGSRLVTYAIPAESGSGVICLNGAAARLASKGDIVILATFTDMAEEEACRHQPTIVRVDERNRIVGTTPERTFSRTGD
ncbi:MAG: aspartate 1-decarboxylase [Deltaproteobacteria bacterium]|nr:aspartate 1-decarboxylase [Deltaproteobacteria bacterium]